MALTIISFLVIYNDGFDYVDINVAIELLGFDMTLNCYAYINNIDDPTK